MLWWERMKKMNIEINGVTLQADFMDADFMEKFEPALYTMRDGINESKNRKDQMVAAGYRDLNRCVETFFNTIWGDEASGRLFGNSSNVMLHLEAMARIETAYREERKQFNDFSNRYTQQQNSFRAAQGHKKPKRS